MIVLVPGLGMPDLEVQDLDCYNTLPIEDFDLHPQQLSTELRQLTQGRLATPIHLVGFSLGADAVLRLAEYWSIHPEQVVPLAAVTLIDPNLGLETMTLSRIFANDRTSDLGQLREVMDVATCVAEFYDLIHYLDRLLPLDTVQAVARQAVAWWQQPNASLSLRVQALAEYVWDLRIHLSRDYANAELFGFSGILVKHPQFGHFDMIKDEILQRILA